MIPLSRPLLGDAEKQAVLEVLDSGMLVQGPRTRALEEAFAAAVGVRHAVATSSGTTALHLALLAAGVGPGDEVITSSFSFVAPANAIVYTGATPVFADIEPRSFNLDPIAVERAVTSRTKAIVVVHLYGRPCDMTALCAIAARHGLRVIEDCAQAIGARWQGRAVGSFGLGTFSLYATKNVTSGEGGMLTTDDEAAAELTRSLRQHGARQRHRHELLGFNYRMTDLHAAIGLVQIRRLAEISRARQDNASFFDRHLTSVVTPEPAPTGSEHVYHQYTVRLAGASAAERDAAVDRLAAAGVEAGVYYPVPAHRQTHLVERGYGAVDLPETERAAREVLALPVHPALTAADRDRIVHAVAGL